VQPPTPFNTTELQAAAAAEGITPARAMRIAESRRIRQVLKQTGGNKTRAAEVLQVSYKTLLTKIKEYRLEE
jgi:DNA-binding NtrC family response regulator